MNRDTKWRVQLGAMFHRDTHEPNGYTGLFIRPAAGFAAGPRVVFADRADAESFKAAILALIDDARDEGAARSESEDTQRSEASQPILPGELVEAVRACLVYFDFMNVTGSLPDQCRVALSLPRKTEAEIRADEREHLMSLALGSEADEYRAYDGHVAEWLRSQTQGET